MKELNKKMEYVAPQVNVEEFNLGDNSLGNLCSSNLSFIFTEDGIFGKGDNNGSLFQ
ncbi:MAG: hypothetical protein RR993_01155 [Clostridia bacterium]